MTDPAQPNQPNQHPQQDPKPENRAGRRKAKQNLAAIEDRLTEEAIAASNRLVEAGARTAVVVVLFGSDRILIGSHDHENIVNAAIERAFNERMCVEDEEDDDE